MVAARPRLYASASASKDVAKKSSIQLCLEPSLYTCSISRSLELRGQICKGCHRASREVETSVAGATEKSQRAISSHAFPTSISVMIRRFFAAQTHEAP